MKRITYISKRVEVCSIDDVLVNIVTSKAQIASKIRGG